MISLRRLTVFMRRLEISVSAQHDGVRLDRFLAASSPALSRSFIQKLIKQGRVHVSGKHAKASLILRRGMRVAVEMPPPEDATPMPQPLPLDIVFEDDDLLVINKPAGMVVHPGAGTRDNTLVNAVLYHCPHLSGIGGVRRPGILHRLDKNTTGLLVVAKNDFTHQALATQLKERKMMRKYWTLVFGSPARDEGIIDAPIGRSAKNRKKMAINRESGRPAVTRFRILRRFPAMTLVEAALQTGRTHQIRVHFSHLGHPVVGDPDYGGRAAPFMERLEQKQAQVAALLRGVNRQMLHAREIRFQHPRDARNMVFTAPLPEDFAALLNALEASSS
jgi:23S rRNA pseudouridine1911/1915/1917 synthase